MNKIYIKRSQKVILGHSCVLVLYYSIVQIVCMTYNIKSHYKNIFLKLKIWPFACIYTIYNEQGMKMNKEQRWEGQLLFLYYEFTLNFSYLILVCMTER